MKIDLDLLKNKFTFVCKFNFNIKIRIMKKIYTAMLASLLFAACTKDDEAVKISSISVLPETATVFAGEALPELALSVTPQNALEGKTVEWTSSDEQLITVDADGRLTFVVDDIEEAEKTVTITATVEDKTATSVITVKGEIAKYEIVDCSAVGLLVLDRNVGATEAYDATLEGEAAEANVKAAVGNYYQWSKNIVVAVGGDEATTEDYMLTWDADGEGFADWSVAANTPCPMGWSIPTVAQIEALANALGNPIEGVTDEALYNSLKFAPCGHFKPIKSGDAIEITKYNANAKYFWSSSLNEGVSAPASWATPGIKAVCAFEDNLGPNRTKNMLVNYAMPVRCVKAVSAE